MKKYGLLFLLILILTACQPAGEQADSVSGDKSGQVSQGKEQEETKEEQNNQEKKENQVKKENQENQENQNNQENKTETPNTSEDSIEEKYKINSKIEDMAGSSIQKEEDFYRNFYEIFVASFYDSDGDGVGDLNGITEKLSYIEGMGFTGLWLMPIHPSDTYHKYDVKDYYGIDPSYGKMEDMEKLLERTANQNISVILDLVLNHTADDHPWFQEAVAYLKGLPRDKEPNAKECPYIDYYYFTKDANKGKSYHKIEGTDWYYEGVFWGEMPDLNVNEPKVRAEFEKIIEFWLAKGVDGFRLDAVKEFFSGYTAKNVDFLKWVGDTARKYNPKAYLVGEAWSNFSEIGEYYASGLPSFFNFALATAEGKIAQVVNGRNKKHDAKSYAEAMVKIEETYAKKNPNYVDALFVANHDNVRMANYFKSDLPKMKLAAGMYLTMTGASFTYYGEEIGMVSAGTKDENKRTSMLWQADGKGHTLSPKDADSFEQTAVPVVVQEKNRNSLLRYYQKALRLRQELPVLARGKVTVLAESNETLAVIEKEWDGQKIWLIYNVSGQTEQLTIKQGSVLEDTTIVDTLLAEEDIEADRVKNVFTIPPYSIMILGEQKQFL